MHDEGLKDFGMTMKRSLWLFMFMFVVLGHQNDAQAQITVPKPYYEPTKPFVEDDFTWSLSKGTGVIAGRGLLRGPGGYMQTAAGEEVALIAKTPYTDEIVAVSRKKGFFDEYTNVDKDPNYNKYRLSQTADAEGRFRFENLPAGQWYIVTRVIWYVRDQNSQVHLQGGLLWGQITIADGEVRDDVKLESLDRLAQ